MYNIRQLARLFETNLSHPGDLLNPDEYKKLFRRFMIDKFRTVVINKETFYYSRRVR